MPRAHRTRLPPWCSNHLRGLRSARVRCSTEMLPVPLMGIRPAFAAWALRADHACDRMASAHDLGSRGSRRLLAGGSSAGPSASPPRGAVPTALAIGLPPWRFRPASRGVTTTGRLGLAYAPAKQAARSLSGLPYKVFPACCPLSHLAVVPLPPRCFAHPRGFEFSRRPLRW